MNLIIFGASRGVGRCLVEHALAHGHRVTAASRSAAGISLRHERLRALTCDVTNASDVEHALTGHDVAFCALGAENNGPTTLYSTGATNIARAMRSQGVRRLVQLSNFGVIGETADDWRGKALLFLARRAIRHVLADHARALEVIRRVAPEWSAVRPLGLTNGRFTGRYRVSVDGLPPRGINIARADVADFMLQQAVSDQFVGRIPAIAY
jgi:putative NADH-flavin reductase